MKRVLFVLVLALMLTLVACGGSQDVGERLLGTWSGVLENEGGDVFPSEWEFLEGGRMIVTIDPDGLNIPQTADYWIEDGVLFIDNGEQETPGRRVVSFLTDDTVELVAEDAGITTTLNRVEE